MHIECIYMYYKLVLIKSVGLVYIFQAKINFIVMGTHYQMFMESKHV